ncbi:L-threonylcarbamoyladenylate synthase [Croceitalea rosinachiae]|uniref:Threonylcarbamoyl-AMP synthase n=1 Tax=Croceitalea rosinachiae TaxID=3075596 RepID=A0ABU3A992_9FLAO|nr:L-threonylcarbamoyladenylate synthase [Croceitalea sp. F388]MDT0606759.1 L-threonylcarbamoyladenylate synthase [Croceitalea sp. F388]
MASLTKNIDDVKVILDAGELVAIPTETVYGLAAKATDTLAIKKIFETKGRPSTNPLILHFASLDSILPYIDSITEDVRLLADTFWPGPLTLLMPKSDLVPEIITAGLPRVAVRVPNHPMTLELLQRLDYPLAAPSANPSGYISPTNPSHVEKQLGTKIKMILDGGNCIKGLESTILGWDEHHRPILYRQGVITKEDLETTLKKELQFHQSGSTILEAPGMLSSHYAPHTKTIVTIDIEKRIEQYKGLNIGLIKAYQSYDGFVSIKKEIVLSPTRSLDEVAKNLYAAMHELDMLQLDLILIEEVPNVGIGLAINDRLRRSSTNNK